MGVGAGDGAAVDKRNPFQKTRNISLSPTLNIDLGSGEGFDTQRTNKWRSGSGESPYNESTPVGVESEDFQSVNDNSHAH